MTNAELRQPSGFAVLGAEHDGDLVLPRRRPQSIEGVFADGLRRKGNQVGLACAGLADQRFHPREIAGHEGAAASVMSTGRRLQRL